MDGNILISQSQENVVAVIDGDRSIFGDYNFELASGWMINDAFLSGYGVCGAGIPAKRKG